MSGIELKHIFKDYTPGIRAVTDFNLTVEEGEYCISWAIWLWEINFITYGCWIRRYYFR